MLNVIYSSHLSSVLLPILNWSSFTLLLHISPGGFLIITSGLSGNWDAMRDAIRVDVLKNF